MDFHAQKERKWQTKRREWMNEHLQMCRNWVQILFGDCHFQEKDDLEARFHDANEAAKQALSEQSSLKQELERTRQQANEALKAMDAERQQLRSANNK